MRVLTRIFFTAIAVIALSYFLPNVQVKGFIAALIVAVVLALLNAVVKPILVILTLPITIISMGLFLLVINALIIMLADSFIGGFVVQSFWAALLFSLLLSLMQSIMFKFLRDN